MRYRKKSIEKAKKIARERDKCCQRCRKKEKLQGSHVIPVSRSLRLAADPDNIKALCYACHFYRRHRDVIAATDWFKEKWPGRYERLLEKDKVEWSLWIVFRRETYEKLCAMEKDILQNSLV